MHLGDPLGRLSDLPGVSGAVTETRSAVDALLAHRVLRQRSVEVSAESALRGARASAELDGASVSLETLRRQLVSTAGESGSTPDIVRTTQAAPGHGTPADVLVEGALRLHAELGTLRSTWERAPRQALARMHVLAASGLGAPDQLGRPRQGVEVADPLGIGPPPELPEVAARLDALVDMLSSVTTAPALVWYAIVHGELLTLAPFGTANGLVARAAGRLVLVSRGLDPKSVTAPEVGHLELRSEYVAAARDYATGNVAGVRRWILHCAQAIGLGAREGVAMCEALARG